MVGTVLVVALFVVGISLLVSGLKHQGDATANSAAPAPADSETGTPQAPGPKGDQAKGMCDKSKVAVGASTDQKTYEPGDKVKLTLNVMNRSSQSCNISAGPKQQEFVIKQGDKTLWSSKYCQSGSAKDATVQFAANSSKPSNLTWDMVPADKNCKPTADALKAGTYQLVTKLGDISSSPAEFRVKEDDTATKKPDSKD